jgi:thiamine-phosphate pyrophosphorylase
MVTPGGLVVLTDRRSAGGRLVQVVEAAVRGGAGWVVLRERDLPYAARRALADQLREVVPAGRLIVAGPDPLGGDAVHLAEADPLPLDDVALVGRSCHGVPALSIEDYVTLSPIYPTETKPGYGPALGPEAAARLADGAQDDSAPDDDRPAATGTPDADGSDRPLALLPYRKHPPVPWLALGGIDSVDRAAECATAGAAGIAVLGAVMRACDPERTARELASAFRPHSNPTPNFLDIGPSTALEGPIFLKSGCGGWGGSRGVG